jgi:hypothetical protein
MHQVVVVEAVTDTHIFNLVSAEQDMILNMQAGPFKVGL